MDNVCHTLVGAALAQSGLKRRTTMGAATLMIGANFPDIDIVAAIAGRGIELRRGWTHGVLALAVLPFVLTALMFGWHRFRSRSRGLDEIRPDPKQLLLLSALSILTHPTLDWMNSYGLRWLMPFDGTWFYGDSLFIIDPWLLIMLGAGVWLSRRREKTGAPNPWAPARAAVAGASAYILVMMGLQSYSERATRESIADGGPALNKLMVTASPANPLKWRVYADDGKRYHRGAFAIPSRTLSLGDQPLEKNDDSPAAIAASRAPETRAFLDWARLPFYHVQSSGEVHLVTITDARYGASITVQTPKATENDQASSNQ